MIDRETWHNNDDGHWTARQFSSAYITIKRHDKKLNDVSTWSLTMPRDVAQDLVHAILSAIEDYDRKEETRREVEEKHAETP